MNTYKIPTEVQSELKISKSIYLVDLFFLMGLVLFRFVTLQFVHSSLTMIYTLFLIGFGLFMVIRPRTNPQKRMYQAMYYALGRKKDSYIATDYDK